MANFSTEFIEYIGGQEKFELFSKLNPEWKKHYRLFLYEFFSYYFQLDFNEMRFYCEMLAKETFENGIKIGDDIEMSGFVIYRMSQNYRMMQTDKS